MKGLGAQYLARSLHQMRNHRSLHCASLRDDKVIVAVSLQNETWATHRNGERPSRNVGFIITVRMSCGMKRSSLHAFSPTNLH